MSSKHVYAWLLTGIFSAGAVNAATYSGSLTYTPPFPATATDEVSVQPSNLQWVNYTVSMAWMVTDTDNSHPGYPWKYTYTFGHDGAQAGISHVIIEGSEAISNVDITGLTGADLIAIGNQAVMSGNPGMPEDLTGLRFAPLTESPFSMTWTFFSNRAPVWGDFYARCGGKQGGINSAYNYNNTGGVESGFLSPDIDPAFSAVSGTAANHYYFHILRPDTVVPEPASLILLGLAGVLSVRRRLNSRG